MALFLPGTKVRPIDRKHLWRKLKRECIVEGTYLSERLHPETKERRVVLALWVEDFPCLIYQWATDFETVETKSDRQSEGRSRDIDEC